MPCFYVATGCMTGQTAGEIARELRARYWETLATGWAYWVPFMTINFLVVPAPLQTVAMQGANLVWSTVLSWIAHKRIEGAPAFCN